MTRNDYLNALYHSLTFMSDEERLALVRSYDTYFEDAVRQGRAESDVYLELGEPAHLAARIRDARRTAPQPEPQPAQQPVPPAMPYSELPPAPPPATQRGGPGRWLGMGIALFFLNLILVPLGAGLWCGLIGFGAASLAALFAPVAVLVDWAANHQFFPATLFASIAVTGAGILMMALFALVLKGASRATAAYARWNLRTWRGW
jgi:uncharacterized membrane protein